MTKTRKFSVSAALAPWAVLGMLLLGAGCEEKAREPADYGEAPKGSPLHEAVQKDDARTVEDLLAKGADANLRWDEQNNKATPLHFARSKRMVEFLLAKGADAKAEDSRGRTPLHYAAAAAFVEVARALVAAGADPTVKDGALMSPLRLARKTLIRAQEAQGAEPPGGPSSKLAAQAKATFRFLVMMEARAKVGDETAGPAAARRFLTEIARRTGRKDRDCVAKVMKLFDGRRVDWERFEKLMAGSSSETMKAFLAWRDAERSAAGPAVAVDKPAKPAKPTTATKPTKPRPPSDVKWPPGTGTVVIDRPPAPRVPPVPGAPPSATQPPAKPAKASWNVPGWENATMKNPDHPMNANCDVIKRIRGKAFSAVVGAAFGPKARSKADPAYAQFKEKHFLAFTEGVSKEKTLGKPRALTQTLGGVEYHRLVVLRSGKAATVMTTVKGGRCAAYWFLGSSICFPDFTKNLDKAKPLKDK